MLTGVYKPTAGEIDLRGRGRDRQAAARDHRARHRPDVPEHPPLPAHDRARERARRHALAPEGRDRRARSSGTPGVRREERGAAERARELLRFSGLRGRDDELARNLAYGDQRRLEVARALATEPKLLLLDEPTAGMNPQETADFTAFVDKLRAERGLTRADDRARHEGRDGHLRSRHRARLRREDRRGHAGRGAERRARDRGLPGAAARRERRDEPGDERRRSSALEDVHTYYGAIHAIKGISIEVHEGEIVTLIGANGAGKSTTLRSINGLNHPRQGKIVFQGERHHERAAARDRRAAGSRSRPRAASSSRA